jgi:hypothetical protein
MVVLCTRASHQRLKRPPALEKKGEKERIREETRRAGSTGAESCGCGGRGRGKSELGQPVRAAAPAYIASPPPTVGSNGRGGIDGGCRAAPSIGPGLVPALRAVAGARARPSYRIGPGTGTMVVGLCFLVPYLGRPVVPVPFGHVYFAGGSFTSMVPKKVLSLLTVKLIIYHH